MARIPLNLPSALLVVKASKPHLPITGLGNLCCCVVRCVDRYNAVLNMVVS